MRLMKSWIASPNSPEIGILLSNLPYDSFSMDDHTGKLLPVRT